MLGDFTWIFITQQDLGEPLAIASRLVPTSSFVTSERRAELVDALIAAERDAPGVRLLKTTPFNYPSPPSSGVFHSNPNSNSNLSSSPPFLSLTSSPDLSPFPSSFNPAPALNPAWRTSLIHVTTVAPWNWNATRAEVHERYGAASRAIEHLRRITGKEEGSVDRGAAYVNEADVYEEDHESKWYFFVWGAA